MQLNTTYLDRWSTPPSKTTKHINHKDNLFEKSNLTPIRGKPTFETLYMVWNKIKENANSI